MHPLLVVVARIRALFRRDVIASEIGEELRFHLEARTDQYEHEGLDRRSAALKARRRVGNLALHQDRGYDVRGGGLLETIVRDVKQSVRLLERQRGFAAVAILTIALGIGASTAIFSVIDAAILRPLPYPHPEQLVDLYVGEFQPRQNRISRLSPSLDDVRVFRTSTSVFSHLAAAREVFPGRLVDAAQPDRVEVVEITDEYLAMHGVVPIQGRGFTADETKTGAMPVAILGFGYWQSRFGGAGDVVGRTISIDGTPTLIVGVLPRGFRSDAQVWQPLQTGPNAARRGTGPYVVGRLRPGMSPELAAQELTAFVQASEPPRAGVPPSVFVESQLSSTRENHRTTTSLFAGAVALILLIACVNVAGLLLARGAARQLELAVRASLGAGRVRLARQLLTESVVLALAGGALGVLIAWLTLDAIVANVPMRLPSDVVPRLSPLVLGASLLLTITTAFLFGLVPALRLSRVRIGATLARGSRNHGGAHSRRSGQALIGVEIAMAVMLVAGAGLVLRSFTRLVTVDMGFEPNAVVTLQATPVNPADHRDYYPALLNAVRGIPGVQAAGAADFVPLLGSSVSMPARLDTGQFVGFGGRMILPGYFEALGVPLRRGRHIDDSDVASSRPVALINEAAEQELFPGASAIGRRVEMSKIEYEIVGVVASFRHMGPSAKHASEIYRLFLPDTEKLRHAQGLTVVVRVADSPPDLSDALRRAATSIGPRAVIGRVASGSEWFGETVVTPRQRTVMLGLLGTLGLLLTVVGVIGMTAYAVAHRTREIGVRMAFGARPGQVVGRIVRESVVPAAIGLVVGLAGALYATRLIRSFLFETTPNDPATFIAAGVTILVTASIAAWLPARRAARVDPVSALRSD